MKRFYKLNGTGQVLGSFAVPQPNMELLLLEEAPDDESMWDGKAWVPDPDIVAAKAAVEAKALEITAAKEAIRTIDAAVSKASDIESLKKVVLDLAKHVNTVLGGVARDVSIRL